MDHNAYIREISGAKHAALLIHGICSTPRHFDWLLPCFDDSWSVYNILLDGHGGSVEDFAHTSMKKWQNQTCQMLDLLSSRYDSILVVGYSLGTLLTLEALHRYPKIRGMLLLNPPLVPRLSSRMIFRSLRFIRGKCNASDPHEAACYADIGISLTPNIFRYIGWLPRFAELLLLCRRCQRHVADVQIPCLAYLGARDELVSLRSAKHLQKNPHIAVTVFPTAGHFFFSPEDKNTILSALKQLSE